MDFLSFHLKGVLFQYWNISWIFVTIKSTKFKSRKLNDIAVKITKTDN